MASCRSQSACRRLQGGGDVFRKRPSRSAVSAVMLRLPRTISFNRLSEIPSLRAASICPTPSGLRYSSRRSAPGGIAGPSQLGSLVIVFDADFVGMSVLPSKRDAILLVHANTVTAGLIALQQLKTVAGRNDEIIEANGGVDQLQFPLDDSPQLTWDSPSGTSISFAEQIRRGLVSKRVNHA